MTNYFLSRNDTEVFACRVRKNLDFIMRKRSEGEDVHEVTQLVISLLGIIIFPWESGASKSIKRLRLEKLEADGWPKWDVVLDESQKGKTDTLGKLLYHLRNAAAHQRISFTTDHPKMESVDIIFEDAPFKDSPINWRASIKASELKNFCERFTIKLEELVG